MNTFPNITDRQPSGPTRFGEDWPGYFIRGDEALGWADMLRRAALQTAAPYDKALSEIADELTKCCLS
ncbi:MAG: hypothetical protein KGL39_26330 [Patescibacteria group bacterium]|nr:hypothetical protein [Patescibacteria group bacterium]